MGNPISFGKWLKQQRNALDLTQKELAKQIGCAIITIQMIEADKRKPSKQLTELLASQLGVSPEYRAEFVRFARLGTGDFIDGVRKGSASEAWLGRLPLRASSNIPSQLTPLIGRDQELASLRQRIVKDGARLLTLVGPPGVGKTRLAIQTALNLAHEFESGAYFIPLAGIRDEIFVAGAIAQALGVNQIGERNFAERLEAYLRDKQMLLVLDNFEQVVSAARLVSDLLTGCPWLSILVTSRAPLLIRGERLFTVRPLDLPPEYIQEFDTASLMRHAGIQLFVELTQSANSDFSLSSENQRAIIALCRHTDGLPLAIELVAAKAGYTSPQKLLELYSGGQILHVDGLRDMPDRHQSLYHAIDWSYKLLTPVEQTLLTNVSVFSGGFTQEAVLSLVIEEPPLAVVESLKKLVEAHLVVKTPDQIQPRYMLLETIREYAAEQLDLLGLTSQARMRHAEYYLYFAESANQHLRGSTQIRWLDELESERSNLRKALAWFFDENRDLEKGLRLAAALMRFWNIRSHISEGCEWLDLAVQRGQNLRPDLRVQHLLGMGILESQKGNLSTARAFLEEGVNLTRQLGPSHRWDLAVSLSGYANVVMYQIEPEIVERTAREALELSEQIGDPWAAGLAHAVLGEAYLLRKDFQSAGHSFEIGTDCMRRTGDAWGTAIVLMDWGYTNILLDNLSTAQQQLEESVALFRSIGERSIRSTALNILATLVQQQEDIKRTTELYNESLDLLRKMGIESSIVTVQYNLAVFVQAHGYASKAEILFKECLSMYTQQSDSAGIAKCRAALTDFKAGRL